MNQALGRKKGGREFLRWEGIYSRSEFGKMRDRFEEMKNMQKIILE